MKTSIIIFSKNRTLQLKSLLLSLLHFSDIPASSINVIYKNDIPEISYEPLINEIDVKFIEQNCFLDDVKSVVSDSIADYFLFMVDDLIARDHFSLSLVESFMDSHLEIDSFSLRMGKNIKCGNAPEFKEFPNSIISWRTGKRLGKHWNYFWDLSSSLYRRSLVETYLSKCDRDKVSFPNPLEDHFYQCMPNTKPNTPLVSIVNAVRFAFERKYADMASFSESKCFTQGVNLVADIDDDRVQQFDPVTLHSKMLDGYVIDFKSLKSALPEHPNAGDRFFRLCKPEDV